MYLELTQTFAVVSLNMFTRRLAQKVVSLVLIYMN